MQTPAENTMESTRRSERVRMQIPVILIWHEGEHRRLEATHTVSVSRFGCLVHCRCNLRPATAVRIEHGNKVMLGCISGSLKDYETKLVVLGIGFEDDASDFWGMKFEA